MSRRTTPPHLRSSGKGWRQCNISGFAREAHEAIDDVRLGSVSPEYADITPGFGTNHPQDVKNLGTLDDPSPIPNADALDSQSLSKSDLGISDQEVALSIRENRPPRPGF